MVDLLKGTIGGLLAVFLISCYPLLLVGCGSPSRKTSEDREAATGNETKKTEGPAAEFTEKGQGYGVNVPYLKPASVYWKARKKITYDILIPKTVQLFEAVHGRKPKSHTEFMEKIIKEGKIQLPKIEEGLEYFYDVNTHQLMVRNRVETKSSPR